MSLTQAKSQDAGVTGLQPAYFSSLFLSSGYVPLHTFKIRQREREKRREPTWGEKESDERAGRRGVIDV